MEQRPMIRLQSGNHWYYDRPEENIFTVEDIAHNLSKEPRYNGSTDGDLAYAVAQHGVNASYIVPPEFAFEALHHDDAEAFYKDITTWLKRMLPDYKRELKRGEDAVATFHGLPLDMSPEVKLADLQMLKIEKLALFSNYSQEEGFLMLKNIEIDHLDLSMVDVTPWHPAEVKRRYLARHEELLNAR